MTIPATDLAGRLQTLGTTIQAARRETLTDMSLVTKDIYVEGVEAAGWDRGSSISWGVGFDIVGTSNPTALVAGRGPLQWLERGTEPHVVTPKGFVGSRRNRTARAGSFDIATRATGNRLSAAKVARGGRQAVRYVGKIRRVAYHPGTDASPFFEDVKTRSTHAALEVLRVSMRGAIRRAGFSAVRQF